ncbi:MAG TPA: dihydrofolate reductase [Candidatus Omnitrophota bacterium]|nr:dihydrofolate reductase [Candidatus Omnitrophota bacterium]
MKDFSIIAAMDSRQGIGKGGLLPWRLSADMAHFKSVTTSSKSGQRNAVIMGRKTWESIPERFRPLPERLNIVLTHNTRYALPEGVLRGSSLQEVLSRVSQMADVDQVFVIGGAQVYKDAIMLAQCRILYLTVIHGLFECDAFFPEIPSDFKIISSEDPQSEQGTIFHFSLFSK